MKVGGKCSDVIYINTSANVYMIWKESHPKNNIAPSND